MRASFVFLVCLSGCVTSELPSNDPDSGVSCTVTESPSGSTQFGALSAYENAAISSSTDGGVRQAIVRLQFPDEARSCSAIRDGGTGNGLFAFVVRPNQSTVTAGTYALSNSADAGDYFYGYRSTGEGVLPIREGTLTITSVADCQIEGALSVMLRTVDGGSSPLGGSFTSTFCPAQ